MLTGAIEYCPPEVFKRPKYHAVPTNVWALGIVLYMMMNGRLPFVSIQETAKACPDWNPDLSNGERIDIHKCTCKASAQPVRTAAKWCLTEKKWQKQP